MSIDQETQLATGINPDQTLTLASVVGDKDLADPSPVDSGLTNTAKPVDYRDAFLKAQALFIYNMQRYHSGQLNDKAFITAQDTFIAANSVFMHNIGVL